MPLFVTLNTIHQSNNYERKRVIWLLSVNEVANAATTGLIIYVMCDYMVA